MRVDASSFDYIDEVTLRKNLDIVFDHMVELVSLSESESYNKVLKSSFRKTVVIYAASIAEALLLYLLRCNGNEQSYARVKNSFIIEKEIYRIDETKRIVLGEDMRQKGKNRFRQAEFGSNTYIM